MRMRCQACDNALADMCIASHACQCGQQYCNQGASLRTKARPEALEANSIARHILDSLKCLAFNKFLGKCMRSCCIRYFGLCFGVMQDPVSPQLASQRNLGVFYLPH